MLILFGDFDLDTDRRELKRLGGLIPLEPQVFDLLVHLVANRDRVVSKDDLIASVWGGRIVSESTLTSRINSLRRALGDSGERQQFVRTIARKGVRFVGEVREQRPPDPGGGATALALPDRPSIAVLPFTDMGGSETDYFGDGMTEEIITALSRVRWFFVIARHSTFAYRDKGMDAKQIARELGVRYVLAKRAARRRSHSRQRPARRGRERQQRLGAQLRPRVVRHLRRAGRDDPDDRRRDRAGAGPRRARTGARQGTGQSRRLEHLSARHVSPLPVHPRGLSEARRLFRQAIAIDPELGPAYSGEAEAYYYEVVYGFAQSNDENREKAIGPAHRAVTLDAEDAGAHCTLGRIRYLRREYPPAISELEAALKLNPSLALATTASARRWCSRDGRRNRCPISRRRSA